MYSRAVVAGGGAGRGWRQPARLSQVFPTPAAQSGLSASTCSPTALGTEVAPAGLLDRLSGSASGTVG